MTKDWLWPAVLLVMFAKKILALIKVIVNIQVTYEEKFGEKHVPIFVFIKEEEKQTTWKDMRGTNMTWILIRQCVVEKTTSLCHGWKHGKHADFLCHVRG